MSLIITDPQFIETKNGKLFTIYHEPTGDIARSSAVLLLYSGDQEYKMLHWAYRTIANRLTQAGWPVLRFDYSATGDSAGVTGSADINAWTEDAVAAAKYLLERSGCDELHIVGARLGSFIAARLSNLLPVLNCILWDSPQSGEHYLEDLQQLELAQRKVDRFHKVAIPKRHSSDVAWVYGFPMTKRAVTLIRNLQWQPESVSSAYAHSLVSAGREQLSCVPGTKYHVAADIVGWTDHFAVQDALMAPEIVKAIVNIVGDPAK